MVSNHLRLHTVFVYRVKGMFDSSGSLVMMLMIVGSL